MFLLLRIQGDCTGKAVAVPQHRRHLQGTGGAVCSLHNGRDHAACMCVIMRLNLPSATAKNSAPIAAMETSSVQTASSAAPR